MVASERWDRWERGTLDYTEGQLIALAERYVETRDLDDLETLRLYLEWEEIDEILRTLGDDQGATNLARVMYDLRNARAPGTPAVPSGNGPVTRIAQMTPNPAYL